jgi:hypothetical protein
MNDNSQSAFVEFVEPLVIPIDRFTLFTWLACAAFVIAFWASLVHAMG